MKSLLKAAIAQTPYRIVRDRGANRFQAIEVTLLGMRDRGYAPSIVIDGGAHLGHFTLSTRRIFPAARFELVEPQPACLPALRTLCARDGFRLHEAALSEAPGAIAMRSGGTKPDTGAFVPVSQSTGTVTVAAARLDDLFPAIRPEERALLKLDLQGHEPFALRGATNLLRSVEAILTEVSFFAFRPESRFFNVERQLEAAGFRLYDIAALSGRARDNRLHFGDAVFVRDGSPLLEDNRWE